MSNPLVDVHTHLFNHRHLPLEGITRAFLTSEGVSDETARKTAELFQRLVSFLTEKAEDAQAVAQAVHHSGELGQIVKAVVRVGAGRQLASLPGLGLAGFPLPSHSVAEREDFVNVLRQQEPWHRLVDSIDDALGLGSTRVDKALPHTDDLRNYFDRTSRSIVMEGLLRPILAVEGGFGYVKFVFALLEPVAEIWRRLQHTYPQPMHLFVHHMMDMQPAFEVDIQGSSLVEPVRPPALTYEEQMEEMAFLHWEARGKLVSFVAFDPRRDNALQLVKRGIELGFVGVKLYPPMGYRPLDHRFLEAQRALYQFCCDWEIPVLTHCSPESFEAYPGHSNYAEPGCGRTPQDDHPEGWAAVLKEFPSLRLCFGHAGGGGYMNYPDFVPDRAVAVKVPFPGWFDENVDGAVLGSNPPCYASQVLALCRRHDHVYCDLSYFTKAVSGADERATLARNLRTVFGCDRLSRRVMYGSDWHMPEAILLADDLYAMFREICDEQRISNSVGFFGANALKWLNLGAAAARYRAGKTKLSAAEHETLSYWEAL